MYVLVAVLKTFHLPPYLKFIPRRIWDTRNSGFNAVVAQPNKAWDLEKSQRPMKNLLILHGSMKNICTSLPNPSKEILEVHVTPYISVLVQLEKGQNEQKKIYTEQQEGWYERIRMTSFKILRNFAHRYDKMMQLENWIKLSESRACSTACCCVKAVMHIVGSRTSLLHLMCWQWL